MAIDTTLYITNDDQAPGQKAVAYDPPLTVILALILDFNSHTLKYLHRIFEIEATTRQGAPPFAYVIGYQHFL